MKTKKWWQSTTVWLNVAACGVAVITGNVETIAGVASPQVVQALTLGLPIANILIRTLKTNSTIKL